MRVKADLDYPQRGLILPPASHIESMTQLQKTFTRETPKMKAELREMLTEAVRNTQSDPKRPLKTRKEFAVSMKS
jgi:hypothetical protein